MTTLDHLTTTLDHLTTTLDHLRRMNGVKLLSFWTQCKGLESLNLIRWRFVFIIFSKFDQFYLPIVGPALYH